MKKNKKLAAAFTLILTAAATMAGAYALGNFTTNDSSGYVDLSEVDENKTAKKTEEDDVKTEEQDTTGSEFGMDNVMDATDEYVEESTKTARNETEPEKNTKDEKTQKAETAKADEVKKVEKKESTEETEDATAQVMSSSAVNESSPVELNFSPEDKLLWPIEGNVIMNYSMDSTVYFATLDQYKYNPAMIIGSEAGKSVKAAADGKVLSVENLDETGTTMTVDIGNGYHVIYGQLKDASLKAGDTCKAGDILGSVSEPSRYYLKEGSNLYFKVEKDGSAINPLEYLN